MDIAKSYFLLFCDERIFLETTCFPQVAESMSNCIASIFEEIRDGNRKKIADISLWDLCALKEAVDDIIETLKPKLFFEDSEKGSVDHINHVFPWLKLPYSVVKDE